jgi:hypothetical protein
MDHDEAIRRSIPFLQELESRLFLTVTDPVPTPPGVCARLNESDNPQETHRAPVLESPQQTNPAPKSRLPRLD